MEDFVDIDDDIIGLVDDEDPLDAIIDDIEDAEEDPDDLGEFSESVDIVARSVFDEDADLSSAPGMFVNMESVNEEFTRLTASTKDYGFLDSSPSMRKFKHCLEAR